MVNIIYGILDADNLPNQGWAVLSR